VRWRNNYCCYNIKFKGYFLLTVSPLIYISYNKSSPLHVSAHYLQKSIFLWLLRLNIIFFFFFWLLASPQKSAKSLGKDDHTRTFPPRHGRNLSSLTSRHPCLFRKNVSLEMWEFALDKDDTVGLSFVQSSDIKNSEHLPKNHHSDLRTAVWYKLRDIFFTSTTSPPFPRQFITSSR